MKEVAYNRTKIIATVGPASNSTAALSTLIKEGVDVFRMNASHGTHSDHQKVIAKVRQLNAKMGTHAALLLDLQGPKIRIQDVEKNTQLQAGQEFIITAKKLLGNSKRVASSYQKLPREVKKGDKILIDDGKIELKVVNATKTDITTKVLCGGTLLPRKGVNLPNSKISISSLTKKDLSDLAFGIQKQVDWIALSFVRKAEDVRLLRALLSKHNSNIKIVAKIEKPEALKHIDAIIAEADAIMVARGDLGVEIWMGEVPVIQKQLIEKCKKATKPVIVATQMMESMIYSPIPTRAETNDVANAVMDGADALMLSAETATGKYPIEAINSMMRIISSIEKQVDVYYRFQELDPKSSTFIHDSLILVASKLAKQVGAKAIVGMTVSGYTAYKSSAQRPHANIFIFTGNKNILNIMSMVWGVRTYFYEKQISTDDTIKDVGNILKKDGHLKAGDIFISLASMPIHEHSRTNMMKINKVE